MNRFRFSSLAIAAALVSILAACGGLTPAPGGDQNQAKLTINTTGSGTVAVDDTAYTGPMDIALNSEVVLTANPAAGWTFSSWGGACEGANPTCTVTMDGDKTVTATFTQVDDPNTHMVTVDSTGNGDVTVNGAPYEGPVAVEDGSDVTIVAQPAEGESFEGWGGACEGEATTTCTITAIDSDANVTATFTGTVAGEPQTVSYSVMDDADGAEEFLDATNSNATNNGYTQGETTTGTALYELTYADRWGSNQAIGLRFLNVDVPEGATITDAYLVFTPYNDGRNGAGYGQGSFNVTISAEDNLMADGFVDQKNTEGNTGQISGRSRLDTTATWSINEANWPTSGEAAADPVRSADIAPLIEGLRGIGELDGTNQIVFILESNNSGPANFRNAYTYDADPNRAPMLVIEYQIDNSGSTTQ